MKDKYSPIAALDSNDLIGIVSGGGSRKKRAEACWLLGKRRERKAISALLRALQHNDAGVRWEAAKALAVISHSDSIRPLIRLMRHGRAANIRQAATYALSFMFSKHSKQAARSLLSVLNKQKEKAAVRAQAAEGLGNLLYRPAFKSLASALNERNVQVRFWSIFALGKLGDTRALPKLKEIAQRDSGILSGWWSIKKEARNAIRAINHKYS